MRWWVNTSIKIALRSPPSDRRTRPISRDLWLSTNRASTAMRVRLGSLKKTMCCHCVVTVFFASMIADGSHDATIASQHAQHEDPTVSTRSHGSKQPFKTLTTHPKRVFLEGDVTVWQISTVFCQSCAHNDSKTTVMSWP